MRPVGLVTAKDILKRSEHPFALRDKNGQLIVGATVGISGNFLEDAAALIRAKADVILIDTARGNSIRARDAVQAIHGNFRRRRLWREMWTLRKARAFNRGGCDRESRSGSDRFRM